jgi:hypothetical protein
LAERRRESARRSPDASAFAPRQQYMSSIRRIERGYPAGRRARWWRLVC